MAGHSPGCMYLLTCNSEMYDVPSRESMRIHMIWVLITSVGMSETLSKMNFSRELFSDGKNKALYFLFKPQTTENFIWGLWVA